jgi:hypothetical protein
MVVVDVVVNDSGGGHTAETEGQGYGRQAENGAAGQRGQETHWMILSGVAGLDSARGSVASTTDMPTPETSHHPTRFRTDDGLHVQDGQIATYLHWPDARLGAGVTAFSLVSAPGGSRTPDQVLRSDERLNAVPTSSRRRPGRPADRRSSTRPAPACPSTHSGSRCRSWPASCGNTTARSTSKQWLGWIGQHAYIRRPDPRYRFTAVLLDASDFQRG